MTHKLISLCEHVSLCWYVSLPVSCRGDEVYAAVDSGVWDPFLPVNVYLLLEIRLILVINKLHDGLPAIQQVWIEGVMRINEGGKRWTDEREESNTEVRKEREKHHVRLTIKIRVNE